jgi:hypothetical protein
MYYRRLLLRKLKEMEDGLPLPAHDPSLDFNQRACSFDMPADQPWQDVVKWQEEYESGHKPLAAE